MFFFLHVHGAVHDAMLLNMLNQVFLSCLYHFICVCVLFSLFFFIFYFIFPPHFPKSACVKYFKCAFLNICRTHFWQTSRRSSEVIFLCFSLVTLEKLWLSLHLCTCLPPYILLFVSTHFVKGWPIPQRLALIIPAVWWVLKACQGSVGDFPHCLLDLSEGIYSDPMDNNFVSINGWKCCDRYTDCRWCRAFGRRKAHATRSVKKQQFQILETPKLAQNKSCRYICLSLSQSLKNGDAEKWSNCWWGRCAEGGAPGDRRWGLRWLPPGKSPGWHGAPSVAAGHQASRGRVAWENRICLGKFHWVDKGSSWGEEKTGVWVGSTKSRKYCRASWVYSFSFWKRAPMRVFELSQHLHQLLPHIVPHS